MADLRGANLQGTRLGGANLQGAVLEDADLRGHKVPLAARLLPATQIRA